MISKGRVNTIATYEISGNMLVAADGLSESEIADAIKNTLATELDIHSSDIEIMYDSDSGVATYTITSDEAESLTPIINELQQDDFDLSSENISIELIDPPTDIILNIDVSVDSSGVIDVDTKPDQTQSVFDFFF
jgi:hypothetical protein